MLLGFGADDNRLEAEVREGADIHVIDIGVAADLLVRRDVFSPVLFRELASWLGKDVRTDRNLVANVFVGARMHLRDRAGTDHSDSHGNVYSTVRVPSRRIALLSPRALRR